jgi:hypothetical protein
MADTLYAIAKREGIIPQQLYNLARQGVIKTTEVVCDLGETHKVADAESVAQYLERRAERIAKKAEKVAAELETA